MHIHRAVPLGLHKNQARPTVWVDKTPSDREINELRTPVGRSIRRRAVLQPGFHGPVLHRCVGCTPCIPPCASRYRPGNPRSPPATRRAQTPTTAATLECWRPVVLDYPPQHVARLGRCPFKLSNQIVVSWHRAGFRLYWFWRSRPRGGRPRIKQEVRDLIGRLAEENPDWGSPKIHAELQKLGFTVAEWTVARYLRRSVRRDPDQKVARLCAESSRGDRR